MLHGVIHKIKVARFLLKHGVVTYSLKVTQSSFFIIISPLSLRLFASG